MSVWSTTGLLVGGIGLLLLSMAMVGEGMAIAAGGAMRRLLDHRAGSMAGAIASGAILSTLLQPSRSVTLAFIGCINSGLVSLKQGLGVVYGANLGATVTGWLVAATVAQGALQAPALALVGAGALLSLSGPHSWRAFLGEALAGYGLLLLGLIVLSTAVSGIPYSGALADLWPDGLAGALLAVPAGALLTVLVQSSGVAVALILVSAQAGPLPIAEAAAMVIGVNLGSPLTVLPALRQASADARRVATAHGLYYAVAGLLALALFVAWWELGGGLTLPESLSPALLLALFHSGLNLIGVAILWPSSTALSHWLEARTAGRQASAERARYLDETLAGAPALAIRALTLELARITAQARVAAEQAVTGEGGAAQGSRASDALSDRLNGEITQFVARLQRTRLTSKLAAQLAPLPAIAAKLLNAHDAARDVTRYAAIAVQVEDDELQQLLDEYRSAVASFLEQADACDRLYDRQVAKEIQESVLLAYLPLQRALLMAGVQPRVRISELAMLLDYVRGLRVVVEDIEAANQQISALMKAMRYPAVRDAGCAATAKQPARLPLGEVPEAGQPFGAAVSVGEAVR